MHLSKVRIRNFRRLVDVKIDLDREISIFVGANNSGKTSVAHAMHFFVSGDRSKFNFHDISACCWSYIDAVEKGEDNALLPILSIDLWFSVEQADLHRVIDLLPNLTWEGAKVGIRISFAPQNQDETLARFREHYERARKVADSGEPEGEESFIPPPRSLREYLEGEIKKEYEFKYFVLDEAKFNDDLESDEGYEPQELLREQGRTGKDIVNSLIKVDFLHAQRHLSDSEGGSRSEDLSRHLSRYYQKNLERHGDDPNAIKVLAESEKLFNDHLEQVFADTLRRLGKLGYPGVANPRLVIRSALNPATVMSSHDGAHVHYALDELDEELTLSDRYNGLGFKNLIYMVVELLDLHSQWLSTEEKRPPLHLIFIEEPEAHLHAQLQQVFANKVLEILAEEDDVSDGFRTQLALTTHSPHILYERGFRPIRYFRRIGTGVEQASEILNLSEHYKTYKTTEDPDFLERYLKLTHCDLFFADAAILVEGNVERLLMPQMIAKAAPGLQSCYLSVLEIGGAYAHKFRTLIEFLGITTLIITDLDSVYEAADGTQDRAGKTCLPQEQGAVTSNPVLANWLPGKNSIAELLAVDAESKILTPDATRKGAIRVAYPCVVKPERKNEQNNQNEQLDCAGRTFEVAFALENLDWTQNEDNEDLRLRIKDSQSLNLEDLAQDLHKKVHSSSFKKTDFALALLAKDPDAWRVPHYIAEGLKWLESELGITVEDANQPEDDSQ